MTAARVQRMSTDSGIILICEHASAYIPDSLGDLGLTDAARLSHAAWDIGAMDMAEEVSRLLNAPLISATTSRLVYDCNRPPTSPSAMPVQSEQYGVPGNQSLPNAAKAARVEQIYIPFEAMVQNVIAQQVVAPIIITLHSFTPVFHGIARPTQIGFLHDADPALTLALKGACAELTDLRVDLNAPYGHQDGVTHSLAIYGTANTLACTMIEVRNDLIATPQTACDIAYLLAQSLQQTLVRMEPT